MYTAGRHPAPKHAPNGAPDYPLRDLQVGPGIRFSDGRSSEWIVEWHLTSDHMPDPMPDSFYPIFIFGLFIVA